MVRRRRAFSLTRSSPFPLRWRATQTGAPAPPTDAWSAKQQSLLANEESLASPTLRSLLRILVIIEAFFLALVVVAPLGGVSQTLSPLARSWPWLLSPARALFGSALVDESLPPERGWPALALYAALLVGASCAAGLVIPLCRRRPWAIRGHVLLALVGAAALGITCILLPALPSDDIFSYVLYGRIAAVHGANPLVTTPAAFGDDPFLRLVFWRGVRSVYGPVWLLLSNGLTQLAQALGGDLAVYTALFKLLGLAAHLANAALIWLILSHIAPSRRLLGTLLYAWNPLCLLEFCTSAHNDALMLTFALLGIYCLVRGWEFPALAALGLSIAVKYVLLALLPLYLVLVARQQLGKGLRLRRVALSLVWRLGVVLGVVAVTALPYWAGPQTLAAILYSPPAQQLDNSLLEVLHWPLRGFAQALGVNRAVAAPIVDTGLKLAGLAAFFALWLRQLRQVRSLEGLLAAGAWALLAYVVVASGWFWPWYVTWTVALVALLPWGEVCVAALLLAGGALTLYAFQPLYSAGVYGLRALLIFGPAVAYLTLRHWRPLQSLMGRWPLRKLAAPKPNRPAARSG